MAKKKRKPELKKDWGMDIGSLLLLLFMLAILTTLISFVGFYFQPGDLFIHHVEFGSRADSGSELNIVWPSENIKGVWFIITEIITIATILIIIKGYRIKDWHSAIRTIIAFKALIFGLSFVVSNFLWTIYLQGWFSNIINILVTVGVIAGIIALNVLIIMFIKYEDK